MDLRPKQRWRYNWTIKAWVWSDERSWMFCFPGDFGWQITGHSEIGPYCRLLRPQIA